MRLAVLFVLSGVAIPGRGQVLAPATKQLPITATGEPFCLGSRLGHVEPIERPVDREDAVAPAGPRA